jgi:glutathione S-transferase
MQILPLRAAVYSGLWLTNFTTGPAFRGAENLYAWRWRRPGRPTRMSRAGVRRRGRDCLRCSTALGNESVARPPFACPVLVDGKQVIAQTAAILLYLGPRLKLVGASEADRIWAHQIQLTIADAVSEAHDTHHPVGTGLYYEDQKQEAARAAREFRTQRIPKFLGWLETVLARNPKGDKHLVGARLSYADLSLFQLVEGLLYAFPKATRRATKKTPRVMALRDRVAQHRRVAAYLRSTRRIPFNEEGIFRHYPELDA